MIKTFLLLIAALLGQPAFAQGVSHDKILLGQAAVFDFQAQPCKAISVGIGFTAETAELGRELPIEAPPNPCAEDAAPAGAYAPCRLP